MGELAIEKHVSYICGFERKKDSLESVVMEHLRTNGAYWGLTTLDILDKLNVVDQDEVISWIMECQHESGGFGGNIGHDPHILYTLSVVQVLALLDKIHTLDIDKVSSYLAGLQNEDGSFSGDTWGEVDTRFFHGSRSVWHILLSKTLANTYIVFGYNRRGIDQAEMKLVKTISSDSNAPAILERDKCFAIVAAAVKGVIPDAVVDLKSPEICILIECIPLSRVPRNSLVADVSVLPNSLVSMKPKLNIKALISDSKTSNGGQSRA